ncbi:MAG: 4-hydroxy-3-methylbut-2-enyl diphosphate reductase [Alistipes sp.]|jgi:4-hydroxy-3-methylbut-2-enyl diphosphate reductase|nr:4-hydroxy-3-methylbut-2-enyl diphosphate reductase [Alistipes sp.]
MRVEIDSQSGFCFGVVGAISKAEARIAANGARDERAVADDDGVGVPGEMSGATEEVAGVPDRAERLVSLGDIVHNGAEVARLEALGLETVPEQTDLATLAGRTVLIRAHGEPPATYAMAARHGITLVDATCPVVARLQRTAREAGADMKRVGGQVAIFGRRGHAEVRGLAGQVEAGMNSVDGGAGAGRAAVAGFGSKAGGAIVVEGEADLDEIDFSRPIYFMAQTTGSLAEFRRLSEAIQGRATNPAAVTVRDTVCRQVAGREEHLVEFAKRHDAVVFVAGGKSSNGRVLFEAVGAANPRSHKIESASELRPEWFEGCGSVGVCGATSTPKWLMEEVARKIMKAESNRKFIFRLPRRILSWMSEA